MPQLFLSGLPSRSITFSHCPAPHTRITSKMPQSPHCSITSPTLPSSPQPSPVSCTPSLTLTPSHHSRAGHPRGARGEEGRKPAERGASPSWWRTWPRPHRGSASPQRVPRAGCAAPGTTPATPELPPWRRTSARNPSGARCPRGLCPGRPRRPRPAPLTGFGGRVSSGARGAFRDRAALFPGSRRSWSECGHKGEGSAHDS